MLIQPTMSIGTAPSIPGVLSSVSYNQLKTHLAVSTVSQADIN